MNVKTIVTIALIGLLGVGTAAGIFLSDRSQQQEPPSADIQQEEKEGSACGKLFSKEERAGAVLTGNKTAAAGGGICQGRREEYYLLACQCRNPLPQDLEHQTERVQNGYEMDKRAAPAMRGDDTGSQRGRSGADALLGVPLG